jgi:hypothetical protein
LESRNWGEMKRVYELDVYKLAEELSDMVWQDFDKKHKGQISNFYFLFSMFRERLQIIQ